MDFKHLKFFVIFVRIVDLFTLSTDFESLLNHYLRVIRSLIIQYDVEKYILNPKLQSKVHFIRGGVTISWPFWRCVNASWNSYSFFLGHWNAWITFIFFKVLIVNKISISSKYVNRAIITIDVNNLRNPQLGEGWF